MGKSSEAGDVVQAEADKKTGEKAYQLAILCSMEHALQACPSSWANGFMEVYVGLTQVNLKNLELDALDSTLVLLDQLKSRIFLELTNDYPVAAQPQHIYQLIRQTLGPVLGMMEQHFLFDDAWAPLDDFDDFNMLEDFLDRYTPRRIEEHLMKEIPINVPLEKHLPTYGPVILEWINSNLKEAAKMLDITPEMLDKKLRKDDMWVYNKVVSPEGLTPIGYKMLPLALGIVKKK